MPGHQDPPGIIANLRLHCCNVLLQLVKNKRQELWKVCDGSFIGNRRDDTLSSILTVFEVLFDCV